MYRFSTFAEARMALREMRNDVAIDFGHDAADAAHGDLVRAVAEDCMPEVAAELLRREGVTNHNPQEA